MMKDTKVFLEKLKSKELTARQRQIVELELQLTLRQRGNQIGHMSVGVPRPRSIYEYLDLELLHNGSRPELLALSPVHSLDYLLERDQQREKDGFPRKIRIGKMVKPSQDGDDKVVVVPTTVEEKLIHDQIHIPDDEKGDGEEVGDPGEGGSGEGEEGDVIGEQPVREEQNGTGGSGQGQGGSHEIESDAYDLGKILTEQFKLPNLKDKGKKRSLTKYTYDLTDKNRGFGQVLDKKSTLKQILKTNIALKRVTPLKPVNSQDLIISPKDRTYRILSKEKDFESQAVVFFVRDYSGSMVGRSTEMIVNQHVLIYSWLTYQYENQVESRFILHDTEAKEVENFNSYYNLKVAGGTQVSAAYKLINEIVEEESIDRDYNIYVFHGTDGDDWDTNGEVALPELKKILTYASRVGITIAENDYGSIGRSEVERYIKKSGLLEENSDLLRLDVIKRESSEARLIEGIKQLISE